MDGRRGLSGATEKAWLGSVVVPMAWFSGWLGLIVSVVGTVAAGAVAGIATGSSVGGWYREIAKPTWTPPGWLFGPVWTMLYIAMAVALWVACRAKPAEAGAALAFYASQLALNLVWSVFFFLLRRPDLALADLVLLWLAIGATTVVFWRASPLAGSLMLPYLAWVSFAGCLNAAIWWLNR